jgi:uncharacterized delta-60 repeat protein
MIRRLLSLLLLATALVFPAVPVRGVGELDPTFGGTGIVVTPLGFNSVEFADLAIQPDGKIVVVGYVFNGTKHQVAVVRYHPNGSLDLTFDGDGKVFTDIRQRNDYAAAVAIQPDGKIVVGGNSANDFWFDFALVRYKPDGSLDLTFGQNGKVTTQVGFFYSTIRSLAIQGDGKIVAAGDGFGDERDLAVARYNQDGTLDTTFGGDGIVLTPINPKADEEGISVALQNDGKILVGGAAVASISSRLLVESTFVVARLDRRGQLDPGFGNHGIVTMSFGGGYQTAGVIALQTDNRIVVGGAFGSLSGTNGLMVRLDQSGDPDPSFDLDGIRPFTDGTTGGQAIQPDGRIVVGRRFGVFPNTQLGVTRINANGDVDLSFGTAGNFVGHGQSPVLQTDGKIVLAESETGAFKLVRLTGDSPIPAHAAIQGRIVTGGGRGVFNGLVKLRNVATGESRFAVTNPFGYYSFTTIPTDRSYELTVTHKRYSYTEAGQTFRLLADKNGLVLYADE